MLGGCNVNESTFGSDIETGQSLSYKDWNMFENAIMNHDADATNQESNWNSNQQVGVNCESDDSL